MPSEGCPGQCGTRKAGRDDGAEVKGPGTEGHGAGRYEGAETKRGERCRRAVLDTQKVLGPLNRFPFSPVASGGKIAVEFLAAIPLLSCFFAPDSQHDFPKKLGLEGHWPNEGIGGFGEERWGWGWGG